MLVESIEYTYITVVVSLTMFIQDIFFLLAHSHVYITYSIVYDVFVLGVSKRDAFSCSFFGFNVNLLWLLHADYVSMPIIVYMYI